jgi:hypothetical protein
MELFSKIITKSKEIDLSQNTYCTLPDKVIRALIEKPFHT